MLAKELESELRYEQVKPIQEYIDMLLEPAEWPQDGDTYWWVGVDGSIIVGVHGVTLLENSQVEFGNIFRTKKQAIKARDKIKSLLKETK